MQLEAGKYYRTRDGRKAYVGAVGCPCDGLYQAIGCLCGSGCVLGWRLDGRRHPIDLVGSDLIAPWEETACPALEPASYLVMHGKRYRLVEDKA